MNNNIRINCVLNHCSCKPAFAHSCISTETKNSYDVEVKVIGGGFTGQAGAVRLAIARALIVANEDFKKTLKSQKLLTRDSRVKERKKYGLYGARRSPQFTKR